MGLKAILRGKRLGGRKKILVTANWTTEMKIMEETWGFKGCISLNTMILKLSIRSNQLN